MVAPAGFYEIPGGMAWVKANIPVIIGNKDLAEIMKFGDENRGYGKKPLLHVTSPVHDGGKMWDQHEDPSGLLDNIAAHIDLMVTDFKNRDNPTLPAIWKETAPGPQWKLWEYAAGKVVWNGPTKATFVQFFRVDPDDATTQPGQGGGTTPGTTPTTPGGLIIPSEITINIKVSGSIDVNILK